MAQLLASLFLKIRCKIIMVFGWNCYLQRDSSTMSNITIVIFNPLLLRLSPPALFLLLPLALVPLQLAGSLFAGPLALVFAGAFSAGALLEALAVLHQGLCRGDKRHWLVAWKECEN